MLSLLDRGAHRVALAAYRGDVLPDSIAPGVDELRDTMRTTLREALMIAGDGEVFIAGGGTIYAQTIDHAHRLVLTEVDVEPEGATRFPDVDPQVWREVDRVPGPAPVTAWVTYERREEVRGGRATSSCAC